MKLVRGLGSVLVALSCSLLYLVPASARAQGETAAPPAPAATVQPAPAEAPAAPAAAADTAAVADFYPAAWMTFGVRSWEDMTQGFGDVLFPVFGHRNGLVFGNVRGSLNDEEANEFNVGLGYRHLLSGPGVIVGANAYFDRRESEYGAHFKQFGAGLEFLSDLVDARANVYIPENDTERIASWDEETVSRSTHTSVSTAWDTPEAVGNRIIQKGTVTSTTRTTVTTTRQHFEQYEEAMEGFDAEIGVRLPIPKVQDYTDIRLFAGYYYYNSIYQGDAKGLKGRLEVRALPALFLDAEVFENDDLSGSQYYLGLRAQAPFDVGNLVHGRCPFQQFVSGYLPRKQRPAFADRLTEMVMRDLNVYTEVSETEEIEEASVQTFSTQTSQQSTETEVPVLDFVMFVDGDRGDDANPGTAELPKEHIQAGIDDPVNAPNVFVFHTEGDDYLENVGVQRDVALTGQGFPIGIGNLFVGGPGLHAVVNGQGGPAFNVMGGLGAQNVIIRGFEVQGADRLPDLGSDLLASESSVSLACIAIQNAPQVELSHNLYKNAVAGVAALYEGLPSFALNVHDSSFRDLGVGVAVAASGSSGSATIDGNLFERTGVAIAGVNLGSSRFGFGTLTPGPAAAVRFTARDNMILGGGLEPVLQLALPYLESFLPLLDGLGAASPELAQAAVPDVPIDLILGLLFSVLEPPFAEDMPSLGGIWIAGLGGQTEAEIAGNVILDNLIGIAGIAGDVSDLLGPAPLANGPVTDLDLNVHDNIVVGGGLYELVAGALDGILPATPEGETDPVDFSIAGILLANLGMAEMSADVSDNYVANELLGASAISAGLLGPASMDVTFDGNTVAESLLGIAAVGILKGSVGAEVSGNTVVGGFMSDGFASKLGVADFGIAGVTAVSALGGKVDAVVNDNYISSELLGVLGVAVAEGALSLDADGNIITGSGTGPILELLHGLVFSSSSPEDTWEYPDLGLAGILLLALDDGTVEGSDLTGNLIQNNLLGVGLAAVDIGGILDDPTPPDLPASLLGSSTRLEETTVAGNQLLGNVLGVAGVAAGPDAELSALQVSGNTIVARPYETPHTDVVPPMGFGGVLIAGLEGANVSAVDVRANTISDAVLGFGLLNYEGASASGITFAQNNLLGVGIGGAAASVYGATTAFTMENNTVICDPAQDYTALNDWFVEYMNDNMDGIWTLPSGAPGGFALASSESGAFTGLIRNNTVGGDATGMVLISDDNVIGANVEVTGNQWHGDSYAEGNTYSVSFGPGQGTLHELPVP